MPTKPYFNYPSMPSYGWSPNQPPPTAPVTQRPSLLPKRPVASAAPRLAQMDPQAYAMRQLASQAEVTRNRISALPPSSATPMGAMSQQMSEAASRLAAQQAQANQVGTVYRKAAPDPMYPMPTAPMPGTTVASTRPHNAVLSNVPTQGVMSRSQVVQDFQAKHDMEEAQRRAGMVLVGSRPGSGRWVPAEQAPAARALLAQNMADVAANGPTQVDVTSGLSSAARLALAERRAKRSDRRQAAFDTMRARSAAEEAIQQQMRQEAPLNNAAAMLAMQGNAGGVQAIVQSRSAAGQQAINQAALALRQKQAEAAMENQKTQSTIAQNKDQREADAARIQNEVAQVELENLKRDSTPAGRMAKDKQEYIQGQAAQGVPANVASARFDSEVAPTLYPDMAKPAAGASPTQNMDAANYYLGLNSPERRVLEQWGYLEPGVPVTPNDVDMRSLVKWVANTPNLTDEDLASLSPMVQSIRTTNPAFANLSGDMIPAPGENPNPRSTLGKNWAAYQRLKKIWGLK